MFFKEEAGSRRAKTPHAPSTRKETTEDYLRVLGVLKPKREVREFRIIALTRLGKDTFRDSVTRAAPANEIIGIIDAARLPIGIGISTYCFNTSYEICRRDLM